MGFGEGEGIPPDNDLPHMGRAGLGKKYNKLITVFYMKFVKKSWRNLVHVNLFC